MTRVLALVLAAWLVAGCDITGTTKQTPPPKPLSHAQFVRAANRACAREVRQTNRLKKPTNPAMFDRELRTVIRSYESLLIALHGLAAPASDSASFRRLLAAANGADLAVHRVLDAAEAGHLRSLKIAAKRLNVLGKRFNSRAKKLGLTVCAKP